MFTKVPKLFTKLRERHHCILFTKLNLLVHKSMNVTTINVLGIVPLQMWQPQIKPWAETILPWSFLFCKLVGNSKPFYNEKLFFSNLSKDYIFVF